MTRRVLVVDNHDSFVHTLIGYLRELDAEVTMIEADALLDEVSAGGPLSLANRLRQHDAVMISPGPGTPSDAGASIDVVRSAAELRMPLLGVCLGHQAIGEAFGAVVTQAPELMHGMVSQVEHEGTGVFDGIRSPFAAARYHSLALAETDFPAELRITARAEHGTIMGIAHRSLPIVGVQFHPESVLTESGHRMLGNWLRSAS
ncbi:Anthranilate synthase, amidotransferase component @ Para-aminobenzoate synthase, amidotransferase component [Microbacterium esteraromaticum]|uniref:Anthranilate synthase, amidotransferase component @ Para-aminobenzoate synthase, amidotransferase component n=1 Tax=Microbacterium esteraromaticum TaxID=57043 RepID=A0A1R4JYQ3_9MICO|nr:aminodeoxychorismate/anthranilate synthase component II [Microbacterium esteraromaticum]SJN37187.1 Anthranilate synthase, amidotransferase component @ Para-aminobenzoate synthase, amidotransferase component [Microbacterium esteraromaticum]